MIICTGPHQSISIVQHHALWLPSVVLSFNLIDYNNDYEKKKCNFTSVGLRCIVFVENLIHMFVRCFMFVQNLIHRAATEVVSKGNQKKNILQIKTNKPQLPFFEALSSKDFKCGLICLFHTPMRCPF